MATNANIFEPVNKTISSDVKAELRLQGHYLTGALEQSLTPLEVSENGDIVLTAEALEYIEDLERGIPGYAISITAKSITEMTRYVELRMGYTGKYAQKVAFLILKKQQKEGNPTKNSYQFSKTGFRTEAVSDSLDNNKTKYVGMLDEITVTELDKRFNQVKSGTI